MSKEQDWNAANKAATKAGKKGIELPPRGSAERKNLSLAHDGEIGEAVKVGDRVQTITGRFGTIRSIEPANETNWRVSAMVELDDESELNIPLGCLKAVCEDG